MEPISPITASPTPLVAANLGYLSDAAELVALVDDEQYQYRHQRCHNASIGGHIRHCIDHYLCLIAGLPTAQINYDARERIAELETCTATSERRLRELAEQFPAACANFEMDQALDVAMSCGPDEEPTYQSTSLGRELQFQASHVVHHFAIIKVMCHDLGIELPTDFGVAASTIRHQQAS